MDLIRARFRLRYRIYCYHVVFGKQIVKHLPSHYDLKISWETVFYHFYQTFKILALVTHLLVFIHIFIWTRINAIAFCSIKCPPRFPIMFIRDLWNWNSFRAKFGDFVKKPEKRWSTRHKLEINEIYQNSW